MRREQGVPRRYLYRMVMSACSTPLHTTHWSCMNTVLLTASLRARV